jgi:hypothetical protein
MINGKIVRNYIRLLEKDAGLVYEFRGFAKTKGGHLTEFGRAVVATAKDHGVKQAHVAKLFGISAGAVCQHYAK